MFNDKKYLEICFVRLDTCCLNDEIDDLCECIISSIDVYDKYLEKYKNKIKNVNANLFNELITILKDLEDKCNSLSIENYNIVNTIRRNQYEINNLEEFMNNLTLLERNCMNLVHYTMYSCTYSSLLCLICIWHAKKNEGDQFYLEQKMESVKSVLYNREFLNNSCIRIRQFCHLITSVFINEHNEYEINNMYVTDAKERMIKRKLDKKTDKTRNKIILDLKLLFLEKINTLNEDFYNKEECWNKLYDITDNIGEYFFNLETLYKRKNPELSSEIEDAKNKIIDIEHKGYIFFEYLIGNT
jgi:hypothetical protein